MDAASVRADFLEAARMTMNHEEDITKIKRPSACTRALTKEGPLSVDQFVNEESPTPPNSFGVEMIFVPAQCLGSDLNTLRSRSPGVSLTFLCRAGCIETQCLGSIGNYSS